MSEEKPGLPFMASADGAFTESGAWVIAPRLAFRHSLTEAQREAVEDSARDALLASVLEEAVRGSLLGAERVHVRTEEGGRLVLIDRPEDAPPAPPHDPARR
jgi:hypothetical protein